MHRRIFFVIALLLLGSAIRGTSACISERGNDLTIYLDAGRAVLNGHSPMGVEGYIYLPVFAVLVAPLASLPTAIAAVIWQLFSWLAILWSARTCQRLVDPEGMRPWLGWFCLLAVFRLADSNLSYGQANAFTLAAILKSIDWVRTERSAKGGMLAGAAAAFKILPGVVVLLFGLQRRWVPALIGVGTFLLLAVSLPIATLGLDVALEAHHDWYFGVVRPYQLGGEALLTAFPCPSGQSLVAVSYHLLTDTPFSATQPELRANLVSLDPGLVRWVVLILNLTHAAVFVGLVLKAGRRKLGGDLIPQVALALTTIVLIAPLIHRAHMLWVMLAVAWLASRSLGPRADQRILRFPLFASVAMIGLTSSALIGRSAARWLMGHGIIGFAVELLWITLAFGIWMRSRQSSTDDL